MRYGSVCSGVEAATIGWHPLGWRAAWFAEVDPAASAVLAHRLPEVPNLGDMTAIPAMIRARIVEAPDVLVGGTPCQGYSVAGNRGGLADPRGQLTLSFVECADAIDDVRTGNGDDPCVIVWENVPGVLSMRDNAFGHFLAGLAGEDCALEPAGRKWADAGLVVGPKRAIAWRLIDAQFFGLAQRRKRVFVVASAADGFDPGEILFEWEGVRRDSPPRRQPEQGTADYVEAGAAIGGQSLDAGFRLTNRLNNQPLAFGGNNTSGAISVSPALTAHGAASGRLDFETEAFLVQRPIAFSAKDAGADATDDLSPTLRAGENKNSSANGGTMPAVAYDCEAETEVRRLLPVECERLQGFPDNWTRIPVRFYATKRVTKNRPDDLWEAGTGPDGTAGWWLMQADGPRYKQMGNSMATRCMAWLGGRIQRWRNLEPFRDLIG